GRDQRVDDALPLLGLFILVRELGRDHPQLPGTPVLGQAASGTIQDQAAWRRQVDLADDVLFRLLPVLLAFLQLHDAELRGHGREDTGDSGLHEKRASRERDLIGAKVPIASLLLSLTRRIVWHPLVFSCHQLAPMRPPRMDAGRSGWRFARVANGNRMNMFVAFSPGTGCLDRKISPAGNNPVDKVGDWNE